MKVYNISTVNNYKYSTNFKSKQSDLLKFLTQDEELKKISQNSETKALFSGLSAIAGAVITEIVMFAEQNKQAKNYISNLLEDLGLKDIGADFDLVPKQKDIVSVPPNNKEKTVLPVKTSEETKTKEAELNLQGLIDEKPERNIYLKITSYYPNLDTKYKQLLETLQKEPDNKNNELTLDIIENIFGYLSEGQRLTSMQSYFQTLDEYADSLDNIAKNILSTVQNGQSFLQYLVLLHNGNLTKEDIEKWTKFGNLGCNDFMLVRSILNDTQINNLNNLKEKNTNFRLAELRETDYDNPEKQAYIFRLDFLGNMSAGEKLKTVAQVHEAIHGEIKLRDSKEFSDEFILKDIKSELLDGLVKDIRLDATYNLIKFIKPKALRHYNIPANDIKFLDPQSQTFKSIKEICSREMMNLDENNPKVKEVIDVLNDKELYQNILASRHAKIRFISRFVLKDNPNSNLKQDTKEKMDILANALSNEMDKCYYFCYVKSKRNAPQFYLRESKLGNYVKITLNHDGSIHTIFEDISKERKLKENQAQSTEDKN